MQNSRWKCQRATEEYNVVSIGGVIIS